MATSVPFVPDPKQVGMRGAQASRVFRMVIRVAAVISGETVELEAGLEAVHERFNVFLGEDSDDEVDPVTHVQWGMWRRTRRGRRRRRRWLLHVPQSVVRLGRDAAIAVRLHREVPFGKRTRPGKRTRRRSVGATTGHG